MMAKAEVTGAIDCRHEVALEAEIVQGFHADKPPGVLVPQLRESRAADVADEVVKGLGDGEALLLGARQEVEVVEDRQFEVAQVVVGGATAAQAQAEQEQSPPAEKAAVIFDHRLEAGVGHLVQPTGRFREEVADGFEEDRRLAYVGITRAKEKAVITYATMRRIYNQMQHNLPSRFLSELPSEHVVWHNRMGRNQPMQKGRRPGKDYDHRNRQPQRYVQQKPTFSDFEFNQDSSNVPKSSTRLVYHKKFGMGKVVRLEGDKADVNFEEFGLKKVLVSFFT